jgi:hypothetical protein
MEERFLGKTANELLELLKKHEPVLNKERSEKLEARYKADEPDLKRAFNRLVAFLVTTVCVCLAISSYLLLRESLDGARLALAVVTGTLGSAVAALLSVLDRRAHGWELSNGWKYPQAEPKDKFQLSMVPLFWARPLLGAVMGVLLYVYPWPDKVAGLSDVSIGFWGFVLGYLAKSFLDVLKGLFKNVFGKQE